MTKSAAQRWRGSRRDRAASTTRSPGCRSGPVNLATQDRDLVAQNQKLDVLGAAVAGELGQHLQDLTQ